MGVVLVRAFNPCVRNVPRPSLTFTSVISGIWDFRFSGVTSARKTKKNVLDHGRNKHRSVYKKGRECPGSEKTALNNVR